MRSRADAGESHAEIAKRMGINLTSVAHHLALLTLPPELDEALRSGRCTSPRTLYELAKLQKAKPERVKAIVNREGEITRRAVSSFTKPPRTSRTARKSVALRRLSSHAGRAIDLGTRLESLVARMTKPSSVVSEIDVETPSGLIVTSVITTRSVKELGLKPGRGREVIALVKSTEVSIATL